MAKNKFCHCREIVHCMNKNAIIFAKKCEELFQCKYSSHFSAKNMNPLGFMHPRIFNETQTEDFVKLTILEQLGPEL